MRNGVLLLASMAIACLLLNALPGVGYAQPMEGGPEGAIAVSAGEHKTTALRVDGTVWRWPWNGIRTPTRQAGLDDAIDIAEGITHSIALESDGTVKAWGSNYDGQLGIGTSGDSQWGPYGPVRVSNLSNVKAIGVGYAHSVALKEDGTVWAWGLNWQGQVGDGTSDRYENAVKPTPVQVVGPNGEGFLTGITDVAASRLGTLALKNDGTVWAWGQDMPNGLSSTTPQQVPVTGVTEIAAGSSSFHALALRDDGTVWSWGEDGPLRQVQGEGGVDYLTGATDIAAGGRYFSLAIKDDGTVWSWGTNDAGQLGNGTYTHSAYPVQVKGPNSEGFLADVVDVAGGGKHSLAVQADGTVWAWGHNDRGQLGDGSSVVRSNTPSKVLLPPDAPSTIISEAPPPLVNRASASFVFSSDEPGSTFECKLDTGAFERCEAPKNYTALPNGSHTFSVRAVDAAGNVDATPEARTWTVDTLRPTVGGVSPRHTSITRDTTPTIKATVKDNLTNLQKANLKLYMSGKLISPTKYAYSAATDVLTYNSPRRPNGKKTVKIVATDAAGNVGAKSWYFTIK